MNPPVTGTLQALDARKSGVQLGRAATRAADAVARPAPLPARRDLPEPAEMLDALTASRQLLAAAQREIKRLERRVGLLREQVATHRQVARKARRFAYRDILTGLPNRRLLVDRFNQAVSQCDRQHKKLALLFLDLDGFKDINDQFGHAAGDNLLRKVAARLAACLRASDTACRYGGDEFVVLLPEVESEQAAAVVRDKILRRLALPYSVAGTDIHLTASVGMAVYPVDARTYGELMQVSDRRMYRKKSGRRIGFDSAGSQRSHGTTS